MDHIKKKKLIILRIHSICEDYSCVFRQTATIARTSELVISESDLVIGMELVSFFSAQTQCGYRYKN